jgi:hypothetical protein
LKWKFMMFLILKSKPKLMKKKFHHQEKIKKMNSPYVPI